jgi:hypothetical protein
VADSRDHEIRRLFEDGLPETIFKLIGTTTFSTGAIILAYARA